MSVARRVLVKYGGAAVSDPSTARRLMRDVATVHAAGHKILLVHGGGPQMTQVARQLGIEPTFVGGRRVTDAAMLRVVQMVLAGSVNSDVVAAAMAAGLPAVGAIASAGGFVEAVRRPPRQVAGSSDAVDFGFVADVSRVDGSVLERFWDAGMVPILNSLVCTRQGQLLNLNADTLTRSIATEVGLTDLIYVADVPGVFGDLDDPQTHIPDLPADRVPGLIADGTVRGGMVAKLDEIARVVQNRPLKAWIVGRDHDEPVSATLAGGPGLRTCIHAG